AMFRTSAIGICSMIWTIRRLMTVSTGRDSFVDAVVDMARASSALDVADRCEHDDGTGEVHPTQGLDDLAQVLVGEAGLLGHAGLRGGAHDDAPLRHLLHERLAPHAALGLRARHGAAGAV